MLTELDGFKRFRPRITESLFSLKILLLLNIPSEFYFSFDGFFLSNHIALLLNYALSIILSM